MTNNRIWAAKLDDHYDVIVDRIGAHTATLKVMDGDNILYQQNVALAYGAQFGPDVGDIAEWQEIAADTVDAHKAAANGHG